MNPHSPRKKALLGTGTALLLLLCLEGVLRVLGFPALGSSDHCSGYNPPKMAWMMNHYLGTARKEAPVPASGKRPAIFFFGASTIAGIPFSNWSPCKLLEAKLQDLYGDSRPIVINGGMTGEASYFISEAALLSLAAKPDLVIWYYGNNDWGGSNGFRAALLENRADKDLTLTRRMYEARLYHFLFNLTHQRDIWLSNLPALEGERPWQSYEEQNAVLLSHYEKNVRRLVRGCREKGVPILLCTTGCQLRSGIPGGGPNPPLNLWEKSAVLTSTEKQELRSVWPQFTDGGFGTARVMFELGKHFLEAGNDRLASYCFRLGRDWDGVHNRVLEKVNLFLRTYCREEALPLADVALAFDQASPRGITGWELIGDWMHPTEAGTWVMTTEIAATMLKHHLLPVEPQRGLEDLPEEKSYVERVGFTALEQGLGYLGLAWSLRNDYRILEPVAQQALLLQARDAFRRHQESHPPTTVAKELLRCLKAELAFTPELSALLTQEASTFHQLMIAKSVPALLPALPEPYHGEALVVGAWP